MTTPQSTKILMAGDSSMATNPPTDPIPLFGWGHMFMTLFPQGVVDNRALSGRSTLSFLTLGDWARLIVDINIGDWVIIQFGHNDQKSADPNRFTLPTGAYRENLVRFVHDVRDHGGKPVLATSIARRHFDQNGVLLDTHGQYPAVTREVAARLDVPLLDLQHITTNLILSHGMEESKRLFCWFAKGQVPGLSEAVEDNSHLSRYGADLVACEALQEARRMGLTLADLALPTRPNSNPI
jgi:lysophospholipase L1-like esterase